MDVVDRTEGSGARVALETTLLAHGLPKGEGMALSRELRAITQRHGAQAAFVGLFRGRPTVGLDDDELAELLAGQAAKVNTSNLGVLMHRGSHGATTVSATMELAASAGVRVFATGGIGGVHRDYGTRLDISADLAALTRFPVAVVCSGVKSLLDVDSTREALETLGIPVIGFRTDRFPAFYLRQSGPDSDAPGVDARFDDARDLAAFLATELRRTRRAVLVANPVPESDEISPGDWTRWLAEAERRAESGSRARGRAVTPEILRHLHEISSGATLRANLALIRSNTELAARLASALAQAR